MAGIGINELRTHLQNTGAVRHTGTHEFTFILFSKLGTKELGRYIINTRTGVVRFRSP